MCHLRVLAYPFPTECSAEAVQSLGHSEYPRLVSNELISGTTNELVTDDCSSQYRPTLYALHSSVHLTSNSNSPQLCSPSPLYYVVCLHKEIAPFIQLRILLPQR